MLDLFVKDASESQLVTFYDEVIAREAGSLEDTLRSLGMVDKSSPSSISLYSDSFEAKEALTDAVNRYNGTADADKQITYTDFVSLITVPSPTSSTSSPLCWWPLWPCPWWCPPWSRHHHLYLRSGAHQGDRASSGRWAPQKDRVPCVHRGKSPVIIGLTPGDWGDCLGAAVHPHQHADPHPDKRRKDQRCPAHRQALYPD